jgi:hypothetical protein
MKKINISKNILMYYYIEKNFTSGKIAKILKCSDTTIRKNLHIFKIPIRIIGEWLLGRKVSRKSRKLMSINKKELYKDPTKNPNYIDGRKKSIHYCKDCHKEISWNAERCSSCRQKGEKNNLWLGGKSFEIYSEEFNNKLKESIRKRDDYKCQKCNIEQKNYYRKLDIHHIDYNKKNCNADNLITLCGKCNCKVNKNRNYWKEYFKQLLGD